MSATPAPLRRSLRACTIDGTFFDCTDDRNRAQVLSLHTLVNGRAMVIASLIGGQVLAPVGESHGSWAIFLLSS